MALYRRCTECAEVKPAASFKRDRTMPGGRAPNCRECADRAPTPPPVLEKADPPRQRDSRPVPRPFRSWEWQTRAACRGLGHIMHVPDETNLEAVWAARDVCKTCPVIVACNAWAQTLTADADPMHDVIAGHTWRQRMSARAAARARLGGTAVTNKAKADEAAARRAAFAQLIDQGHTIAQACRELGISDSAGYYYTKRLRQEAS